MSGIRLLVCTTCEGGSEERVEVLRSGLRQFGVSSFAEVVGVECLGACADPVSIGMQGAGRASYVFGGIRLEEDAKDIAATLQVYHDADKGWIEDARGCGRLRNCLRARIPAL